ncbi:hypothetical protein MMC10_001368 [Thelotrema lepadinum]|nr:hypothetical protein [Thelotrema lepadinum]
MTQSTPEAIIEPHLSRLLTARESPKTICPSEVARALLPAELKSLGALEWKDLMPVIREMLWKMRDGGEVQILQKGSPIPHDVSLEDIRGPIRARRVTQS